MKTSNLIDVNYEIFLSSREGILVLDEQFRVLEYNPAFGKIFRLTGNHSNWPLGKLFPTKINPDFFHYLKQHSAEATSDLELICYNKKRVWASVIVRKHTLEFNTHYIVLVQDLSLQKKKLNNQLQNLRLYFSLFEDSPVPIWDEDFSGVKKIVDELKAKGVTDIEAYLRQNPSQIDVLASKILVNKINKAVVILNEAKSKDEVLASIPNLKTKEFPEYIIKQVKAIFNDEKACEFDAVLKTVKGNIRHVLFKWTVVKGYENDYKRVYLTTTDLTQRIIEENLQLQRSNREKEVLLREIHHRVKNNFQIISSLIRLQIESIQDEKLNSALQILLNRIYSMATVHEILYRSDHLEFIRLEEYLVQLLKLLIDTLNVSCEIDFEVNTNNLAIPLDQASPFGLIINELITNSIKHGLQKMTNGKLYIHAQVNEKKQIELFIGDNGSGITQEKKSDSLGLNLVQSLVDQLNATLIELDKAPGTHYKLILPSLNL